MKPIQERDEAAIAWRARKMSGEMSSSERAAFEEWLNADAENRIAFEEIEEAAASLDSMGTELLAESFESELTQESLIDRSPSRKRMAIAASVFLVVLSSIAATFFLATTNSIKQTYATRIGQNEMYSLRDGSAVHLNTNTALYIEYSRRKRLVEFASGEALFNVVQNPKRPFIVKTANAEVFVTGTVFNVFTQGQETIVSVVSGTVDVTAKDGPMVTLLAGQRVSFSENKSSDGVTSFNPNESLAWRSGKVRFDRAPLAEAVADLNRYFARPIILDDPSLHDLSVTGEFDVNDQQTVVNALVIAFALNQTPTESAIKLTHEQKSE